MEPPWFARLYLAPGESRPWHRDPFHRVAVVLSGDVLLIEYRDGRESLRVEISSGQVDWEEPSQRVHRAINVGQLPYVQITVFSTATTRFPSRARTSAARGSTPFH